MLLTLLTEKRPTDSTDHNFFNLRSLHHINLQVDDFNLVVNQNTPLLQLFSGFFKSLVHKSPVCSERHKKNIVCIFL